MAIPLAQSTQGALGIVLFLADPQQLPALGGRTMYELYLSLGVLGFGLLTMVLEIFVMLWLKKGWGPISSQVVGITFLVTAGVFLITAGYSREQISPMIGLLGTIAGYLLGRAIPRAAGSGGS